MCLCLFGLRYLPIKPSDNRVKPTIPTITPYIFPTVFTYRLITSDAVEPRVLALMIMATAVDAVTPSVLADLVRNLPGPVVFL